ncbi:PRC-barrel domain-containing protein [Ferruginibacter sp.]|uniref:PRC-barrel domain-containing protein n=1 Tax=Ferruginibacter sp. TaxID=1940288 RepID=UPI001993F61B|nr:PRC-barrel domain-containing protein [Ferruginibacter sp.]
MNNDYNSNNNDYNSNNKNRNINSLLGYTIIGTDGEIGKVAEFYLYDRTFTIRYVVVKTAGWSSEKSFDFAQIISKIQIGIKNVFCKFYEVKNIKQPECRQG